MAKALPMSAATNGFSSAPLSLYTTEPSGDGIWRVGSSGGIAANRVLVVPYAHGSPGQTFSVRLTGWKQATENPDSWIWLPLVKIQMACIVGDLTGPSSGSAAEQLRRVLAGDVRFCDQITLTTAAATGSGLGLTGELMSPGPQSGMAAWIIMELRGCQYLQFQFDFLQDAPVPMNAFWCKV